MSKASLPSLPPDLEWLLNMSPTYADLATYLNPPDMLLPTIPANAHNRPFSISNIFTSPLNVPDDHRAFDLAPGRLMPNNYANVSGRGLLIAKLDEDPIVPEGTDFFLTPTEGFGGGKDWFVLSAVNPETRRPDHSPAFIDQREKALVTHNRVVNWLCETIEGQWESAFWLYQGQLFLLGPEHRRLFLSPRLPTLPDPSLIEDLRQEGKTHHIFLLTVRHELGHIYEAVKAWHNRVPEDGFPDPNDKCLTPFQVGLMSARARGRHYWKLGPSADRLARPRDDALVEALVPQCDLSRLYYELYQWCKAAYEATLAPPKCKREDCVNTARLRVDGKGWQQYCSEECFTLNRRATYRNASRKYRNDIKSPKRVAGSRRVNSSQQQSTASTDT